MDVKSGFPPTLDAALLIARLVAGLMFASSGWLKLTRADRRQAMIESLQKGHIPAPGLMSRVLPVFELVAGLGLAMGLFTGFSALVLLVICLVALATVTAKDAAGEGPPLLRFSSLLYTPEALLISLLLLVLAAGAGGLSADAAIA